MYTKQIHGYRILEKPFPSIDKWQLLRLLGKDTLSPKAQLKLEWIIFYQTIGKGNACLTAKHFGINPKTTRQAPHALSRQSRCRTQRVTDCQC